jgi:hypothetical protein
MKKEIEGTGRWNDLLCSWIGRTNIVKVAVQHIPHQNSNIIFSTETKEN